MNISILIIGFSAVILSAISSMPQLYKIITTKKVRDINIYFFICRILAAILYFIYGILIKDIIMMVSVIMPSIIDMCIIYFYCNYNINEEENIVAIN